MALPTLTLREEEISKLLKVVCAALHLCVDVVGFCVAFAASTILVKITT